MLTDCFTVQATRSRSSSAGTDAPWHSPLVMMSKHAVLLPLAREKLNAEKAITTNRKNTPKGFISALLTAFEEMDIRLVYDKNRLKAAGL
jgi:hypothetical protein